MNLIYCYDAYCGWCYGFSPVLKQIAEKYNKEFFVEVLSGGMILPEIPQPIEQIASVIREDYQRVEEYTGVKFGKDFLWHAFNPEQSDWFPNSLKPAIALSVIKDFNLDLGLDFASDIQYALNFEGRDLTDDEAYRHLLTKYGIEAEKFYADLHSELFLEKAQYDFALVKQLQVTSYPALLLQESESKFHLLAKGFTDFETLDNRITNVLKSLKQ